jgi:hypothetical protein
MSILQRIAAAVQSDSIPEDAELVPPELVDPFLDDDAMEHDWDAEYVPLDLDDPACGGDDLVAGEPTLPFAAWIECHAARIRSGGTDAAAWLAGKLDELAATARFLDAQAPGQFDDRLDLAEDELRARLRAEGFGAAVGMSARW